MTFAVLNPNEAGSFGAIGRDVLPDNILSSSDGGLSFEVFENRLLQINIQAHRLGISDPIKNTLACPTSCGDIIRGRMGDFGPGIKSLSGFAVNGRPVSVRLDTLYDGPMFLSGYLKEVRLLPPISKEFPDIGYDQVTLTPLGVGTLTFLGRPINKDLLIFRGSVMPGVFGQDYSATIGLSLLRSRVVTFDFRNNKFWFD